MAKLVPMDAVVDNPGGRTPVLLLCDHASNFMPDTFAGLGLSPAQLADHVAWDIGAHALARRLSSVLDAPLVAAPASRLLVDPNRALSALDLIPDLAEGAAVPGNANLTAEDKQTRIGAYHAPYHDTIESMLAARPDIVALLSVHSFTPVMLGAARPWHAGLLHGADARIADVMIEVLAREPGLVVGRNEPYAPEHGVFYTLDRHGAGRATAMIEVRNDLIRDELGQEAWARRLAAASSAALNALASPPDAAIELGGRGKYAT